MQRRSRILLLVAFIAICATVSAISRDLFVGDETKYGQIIREMRATGSLLVPLLNGGPYSHKPPLHFWLVYLLTFVFGLNSILPFVLPSLISFALMLWLISRLGDEFFGGDAGPLCAFYFSTFYLAFGLAQTARMDIEYVLLISAAALFLHRFLSGGTRSNLLITAALIGVAILIKGPMALIMLLLLFVFESYRRRKITSGPYLRALLIVAVIPLLWLVPALLHGGAEYAHELLIKQNVGRAIGSWVHKEAPWWYLTRFPVTFLPWFFVALLALIVTFRKERRSEHHQSLRFCSSWIAAVFLPFSIISGKLDVYMLPAMVPFALLLGAFTADDREDVWTRYAVNGNRVVTGAIGLIFLSIPLLAAGFAQRVPEVAYLKRLDVAMLFWSTAGVALIALIAQRFVPERLLASSVALGLTALFPIIYASAFLMPFVNGLTSTRPIVEVVRKQKMSDGKISLFQSPHLWSRDANDRLDNLRYINDVEDLRSDPTLYLIARSDRAHHLSAELPNYVRIDEVTTRGKRFDFYRRR